MEESVVVSPDDTIILDTTDESIIFEKLVWSKPRPRLMERQRRCFLFHCLLRWNDRKFEDVYDELLIKVMGVSKPFLETICELLNNSHLEFCANWNPVRILTKYGNQIVMDSRITLILHLLVRFYVSSLDLSMHFRNKLKNKMVSTLECVKVLQMDHSVTSRLDYDVFKLLLFGRVLKCNSEFNLISCYPNHLKDIPHNVRTKVLRLEYSTRSPSAQITADFYAQRISLPYFRDPNLAKKMIPSGAIQTSISEFEIMMTLDCTGPVEYDYFQSFNEYRACFPHVKKFIVKLLLQIYPTSPLNAQTSHSLMSLILRRWRSAGLHITVEVRYFIIQSADITLDENYVVAELNRLIFGENGFQTLRGGSVCQLQDLNTVVTVKLLH
uniref:FBD domain-containing protein n=1 Tax=Bursaphelenchus xylophilus TaxID=6326 RepID=A0A1I7RPG4_BURXY